jgi:hypothetical protein
LDTREYEVVFPDGSINIVTANAIAKSLYSQVDKEGRSYSILSEIVDHQQDGNAILRVSTKILGTNRLQQTTKGWQSLIKWKDGSYDWLPLADLKESYPVQVCRYAVNNKIALEPAFAWLVGITCTEKTRSDYKESTDTSQEANAQVWHPGSLISTRGFGH